MREGPRAPCSGRTRFDPWTRAAIYSGEPKGRRPKMTQISEGAQKSSKTTPLKAQARRRAS